jgi:hypothetical protein
MWIKNNPALKGESYQNGINRRAVGVLSTNVFSMPDPEIIENPIIQAIDNNKKNNSNDDDVQPFSVKNALMNLAQPTLKFFKRIEAIDTLRRKSSKNSKTSTTTKLVLPGTVQDGGGGDQPNTIGNTHHQISLKVSIFHFFRSSRF